MTSPLPHDAARMAWWLTAWLRGRVSPDALRDAVVGADAAHDVVGFPGDEASAPLLLSLGRIRGLGAASAGLALPVPGDLVGLGGPAGFNGAALEAGEAVVLEGAGLGMLPERVGRGVVWRLLPANRRPLDDLGSAGRALRVAVIEAAGVLADLDVAKWRPEVADELMDLHHVTAYDAPAGTPRAAVDLAGHALQSLGIVDLALDDDGSAVSAWEAERRVDALRPLSAAARGALVAACSPEAWPPD